MPDPAIIQNLLEQVGPFVPQGAVLREVRIDAGRLEHLDDTVMEAARSPLTEATEWAGTTPHIDRTPVRPRCRVCGGFDEPADRAGPTVPEVDLLPYEPNGLQAGRRDPAALRDDLPRLAESAPSGAGLDGRPGRLQARRGARSGATP